MVDENNDIETALDILLPDDEDPDSPKSIMNTLNRLMDTDDITMLKGLILRNHYDVTSLEERWAGGPHRLATGLANILASMANISQMVEGVVARQKFGAAVLLVCSGRLWGCIHHEIGWSVCKRTDGKCMVEDVIVCPSYEVDYDQPLYQMLDGDKVIGCLWCGSRFKQPRAIGEPYNMSAYMCMKCQRILTGMLARQVSRLTHLALSGRVTQLPGGEKVKQLLESQD